MSAARARETAQSLKAAADKAGGLLSVVAVIAIGLVLHAPLRRLPETHLKYVVGVVLTSFGVFFTAEGLGVEWPGSDAALLYVAAALVVVSQMRIAVLARPPAARVPA